MRPDHASINTACSGYKGQNAARQRTAPSHTLEKGLNAHRVGHREMVEDDAEDTILVVQQLVE
jgi:hypothetical protein